ncbi:hypothetical protein ACLFMI_21430 [Pseudonocardia nantongensis]|uniref:hypothetical protein n=1 Tax=Pseudonocardia nantongensis TaxID=1181885 RepID=UPI00397BCA34
MDLEQVLAWDPDIILLGKFAPTLPEDLYRDPAWAAVDAVRARRVYKVPLGGYRWDPPNQESPLMWEWLAGLVARGEVPRTLPASIRTQYAFPYGAEPSDAQIAAILQSTANRESVGYAALGT